MPVVLEANQFSSYQMLPVEAAYVAGLMDGEGSIYLTARRQQGRRSHHFNPEVTMGNTSLMLLQYLRDTCGNGAIYKNSEEGNNHKASYRWFLQPSQIRHFLPQVLPFLVLKRPQAELMLEFFELQRQADYGPMAWESVPQDLIQRIIGIYDEIRALNHRGLIAPEPLQFSFGEGKERKRTCDTEGCEDRRYRGHDVCYKHWLSTREPLQKICEECSTSFEAVMQKARFCTPRCQWRNAARRRAEAS